MSQRLLSWVVFGLFLLMGVNTHAILRTPFEVREIVEASEPNSEAFTLKYPAGQETFYLAKVPFLDHSSVKSAKTEKDALGYVYVTVSLTDDGAKRLKEFTAKHVGGRIAILFGGRIESTPFVREPIAGGIFTITGNFSEAEANELVRKINEAARP